ncbi:MAG: hypothetical protein WCX63_09495 [Methanoregula sp.]
MHDEAISKYLDEIPAEIRDAVSELSSSQRWAVFLAILKEDRYFNELKHELGISAEQLDNLLRRLVIGGLVYKKVASPSEIGDRKKTYYTITPSGKILIRSLLDGFLPESRSPGVKKTYAGYLTQNKDELLVCEADPPSSLYQGAGYRHPPKKTGSHPAKKPSPKIL